MLGTIELEINFICSVNRMLAILLNNVFRNTSRKTKPTPDTMYSGEESMKTVVPRKSKFFFVAWTCRLLLAYVRVFHQCNTLEQLPVAELWQKTF